jgi:hypothetical protein
MMVGRQELFAPIQARQLMKMGETTGLGRLEVMARV